MSIKRDVVNGVFWIALARYSGILITLAITAILARLISPSAFGTVAIATVILHFLNILADIGIGPAIVQYKNLSKKNLSDIYTITIAVGFVLSVLLFLASDFISEYYKDDTLENVCQLMCIIIVFNSMNVVPNGLMRREKRFKTIAIRTLFFQFLGGIIAIWAAFGGLGVYALVISPICTAIGVFCVNYYNYPLPISLHINRTSVTMISSFSIYQFLFQFCNYFSRNLDKLIIGKSFSMAQLGYYDKSYHLMLVPVQNISSVIEPVLHPILSSLQANKSDLKNRNIRLSRLISYISFPVGLILFFCSFEIIRIVYGDKWDPAIPIFRILALSLPLQVIFSTIAPMYQTAGKTKIMFIAGILNTCVTITGFMIAIVCFGTLESMAWSWDLTLFINFCNSYYLLHRYAFNESSKSFFCSLLPQIGNSLLVFLFGYFFFQVVSFQNVIVSLCVKSSIVILCTILLAILLHQYKFKDVLSLRVNCR